MTFGWSAARIADEKTGRFDDHFVEDIPEPQRAVKTSRLLGYDAQINKTVITA